MLEKKIAEKIRRIRKSQGLTLASFGEAIGLSKALLSRIENNQVAPPIATLSKIANGLGVPISVFFEDQDDDAASYSVTPSHGRRQVIRRGTRAGFIYFALSNFKKKHLIQPFLVQYPVIDKQPTRLFDHPGEEFLFVLKGQMELVYGNEKIRLGPGDAIHFDPSVPHRGQNVGNEVSECLVVVIDKET